MAGESAYYPLSVGSLRALGRWAADGAARALPVFEKHARSDSRPRAAIPRLQMSARRAPNSRPDTLLYRLDAGIRPGFQTKRS